MPSVPPPQPNYPMQMISLDYFNSAGKNVLVIVDRYSGWPVIKLCCDKMANKLIQALQEFFCQNGTPEQLASDGGPVYTSSTTQSFLKTWRVLHPVSQA